MPVKHRFVREGSRRAMRAVGAPLAAIVLAFCAAAPPARAQYDGHSYLRIKVAGHPIRNYVQNEKYTGWLQIEAVDAKSDAPVPNEKSHVSPADPSWHPNEKDGRPWTDFPAILRSGRAGSGRFSFGAGDGGEMKPLFDAQKHKSLIPSAELDLYDEDGGALIGKYLIKGIHVLSLEDVKASACAMYEINMSFQSVEKI
jgi:hypothetical protein